VAVVALLPFGLRVLWQRFRRNPGMLLLGLAALFYPVTQALRLVPSAWETGVRTSDFVFIGAATVVALAVSRRWPRVVLCALAALLIAGGMVSGESHDLRLAPPYRISAHPGTIDPPAVAAARWTLSTLGRGRRFAADETDARFLQAYGGQIALAGSFPDIVDLLHSPGLESWEPGFIRRYRLDYAAVDRLPQALDREVGFYYPTRGTGALAGARPQEKFDESSRTDRIYDNGGIVIYDISRLGRARPAR
jgi:hypothetical protein